MAELTTQERFEVWAEWMVDISITRDSVPNLLKTDLRAAVDALDTWVNDNAVSANNALPTAAKDNLTDAQKAKLLSFVVFKRYVVIP